MNKKDIRSVDMLMYIPVGHGGRLENGEEESLSGVILVETGGVNDRSE